MPIPGYQDFMLPLLKVAYDGKEHSLTEVMPILAADLQIAEEDQNLMLPSGTMTRFYNRVCWAVTYLTKSRLLDRVSRGRFKISSRGVLVLQKSPARIDGSFLDQFPEFIEFKSKRANKARDTRLNDGEPPRGVDEHVTPEEQLEAAYEEIQTALADDLLIRVRASTPKSFEHLVVRLLVTRHPCAMKKLIASNIFAVLASCSVALPSGML